MTDIMLRIITQRQLALGSQEYLDQPTNVQVCPKPSCGITDVTWHISLAPKTFCTEILEHNKEMRRKLHAKADDCIFALSQVLSEQKDLSSYQCIWYDAYFNLSMLGIEHVAIAVYAKIQ